MIDQLLIGFLFALLISGFSYRAKFLTLSGSVAQFILGIVLLGFGGWQWTFPIVVFFVLSSFLSKFDKRQKAKAESLFEKSSCRDAWQVFVNGGVAGAITLLWFFTHHEVLFVAYLGSVAAATADTWSTEIGTLSNSLPRLVTTWKKVESGRSGGVSVLGSLAGFLGAATIASTGLVWIHNHQLASFVSVVVGGVAGSVADSIIGATLQLQFRCEVCGWLTERELHCGAATKFALGIRWMKNDLVNFCCTLVGSIVAYIFFSF